MPYKVREGFYVHHDFKVYEPGTIVELTEAEAADRAHQVEPVEQPKVTRKAKVDAAE